MNGELLQMAKLVVIGNYYLKNGIYEDCIDYRHISCIEFERATSIMGFIRRWPKKLYCIEEYGIISWLDYLRSRGIDKCYLLLGSKINNLNLLAYSNGIPDYLIACPDKDAISFWSKQWMFFKPLNKWNVKYSETVKKVNEPFNIQFPNNIDEFINALQRIEKLAIDIDCNDWAKRFNTAYRILNGEGIEPLYQMNIHNSLNDESKRIFYALTWAWVFGGMGSWNDSPPFSAHKKGKIEEFNVITKELYDNIISALMYCVNS